MNVLNAIDNDKIPASNEDPEIRDDPQSELSEAPAEEAGVG